MGLYVSTTGSDVPIHELGITITHPTTDRDLSDQFTQDELQYAHTLTTNIRNGTLTWKKTSGGSAQPATDYDPDFVESDEPNTGDGLKDDRVVTFKDLGTGAGPNGGGPFYLTNPGSLGLGDYFYIGNIETSKTAQLMKGSNKLYSMSVTSGKLVTDTAAQIQLFRRTGVSTRVDITGAIVTVPVGEYKGDADFDILLPDDPELGAYMISDPSNFEDAQLLVYLKYMGPSSS